MENTENNAQIAVGIPAGLQETEPNGKKTQKKRE